MSENHREPGPSGRMSRWPCKDYLRGTCNNSFCEKWHPPECLFYKSESGSRFGEKCSYAHRQVDQQPCKRSEKNEDKSAVAMLKKNEHHHRSRVQTVTCLHQYSDNHRLLPHEVHQCSFSFASGHQCNSDVSENGPSEHRVSSLEQHDSDF